MNDPLFPFTITPRIPLSLFRKTPTLLPIPTIPFFPFKPITFQRLPPPLSSPSPSPSSTSLSSLQPIEDLPPKLQEIVHLFQSVTETEPKYYQLIVYGKNLKPLEPSFKTNENKVQCCLSQVWVRAYLDPNRNVVYEADSDSSITKGLAALLVQGLSGRPVSEIIRVTPDFFKLLGLPLSSAPSRNNGFLNMLTSMQRKALMLYVEAEKGCDNNNRLHSDESQSQSNSVVENLSGGIGDSERELVREHGEGDVELGVRGKRISTWGMLGSEGVMGRRILM